MSETFTYRGRSAAGVKLAGEIHADSQSGALDLLQERGITVTGLDTGLQARRTLRPDFLRQDFGPQLLLFARHLATYHRSGIPLLKALSLIRVAGEEHPFQKALTDVRRRVAAGKQLSDALNAHPAIFGEVFVNAVQAGEASGHLATILDDSSEALEQEQELRRQIRSSLRYPLIVVIAIALAIGVIVTFVVPKFAAFYGKFGSDLPTPTRIIVWISDMTQRYWYLTLSGAAGIGLSLRKLYLSERGRAIWDRIALRLPVFGDLIIKAAVARFALLFQILFKAGIPIVKSLSLLETSQSNTHLRAEIQRMRESFESGRELERSQEEGDYFPEMAHNMIKSGLESGALEMMLGEIGHHYSREVNHTSKNLAALIEPMLTVAIGAVVLLLALAIFLPMWNMIKVFQ